MSVVWTPFRRNIVDLKPDTCAPEPLFEYTPYQLFSFKTHLMPLIRSYLGPTVDMKFTSKNGRYDDYLYLCVVLTRQGRDISMNDDMTAFIQTGVNAVLKRNLTRCLLFLSTDIPLPNGRPIPSSWIRPMFPYLDIDPKYDPIVTDNGIEVNLGDIPDYDDVYRGLIITICDQLIDHYTNGYIINPPRQIIEQWSLSHVAGRLYRPDWTDDRITYRYANMTEFITSRLVDNTFIELKIPSNWVQRHHIIRNLSIERFDVIVDGEYIQVMVDNLKSSQRAADIIDKWEAMSDGQVITIDTVRLSWVYYLINAANELGYVDSVGYRTNKRPQMWTFSLNINVDDNIYDITNKVRSRAIANLAKKNKLLNESGGGSPHDIMETRAPMTDIGKTNQ